MKQHLLPALSLLLVLFAVLYHIVGSRIAVQHLKNGETLTLSVENSLPEGEYELEYYIACSGSSPALTFTLQDRRDDGEDILFDERSYTTARGFGRSRFTVAADSRITAVFTATEDTEKNTWAGIGGIRVRNTAGDYVGESLHRPKAWGKQPFALSPATIAATPVITPARDIPLSDFATLTAYDFNGTTLTLNLLCTGKTETNHELGLTLTCGNINVLLPKGESHRFYGLTPPTGEWQVGETYTQTLDLKLAPETYGLHVVLPPVSPGTPSYIKQFQLAENPHKTSLGNVTVATP